MGTVDGKDMLTFLAIRCKSVNMDLTSTVQKKLVFFGKNHLKILFVKVIDIIHYMFFFNNFDESIVSVY